PASLCGSLLPTYSFSSRRRPPRLSRDWSSDVCSSDLMQYLETLRECILRIWGTFRHAPSDRELERELEFHLEMVEHDLRREGHQIGRASCRERVRISEAAGRDHKVHHGTTKEHRDLSA